MKWVPDYEPGVLAFWESRLELVIAEGLKFVLKMGITLLKSGVKMELTDVKIVRKNGKNLRKKYFFGEFDGKISMVKFRLRGSI